MVDAGDAQLLEALDATHDVHQRIQRSDLVERDRFRRHAVHLALRLADQPERAYRALPDPGRERRALHHCHELAHVPVCAVDVPMGVGGLVQVVVIVLGVRIAMGWGLRR
jgi:hypothetical protein